MRGRFLLQKFVLIISSQSFFVLYALNGDDQFGRNVSIRILNTEQSKTI
jgi:hypothetical protein